MYEQTGLTECDRCGHGWSSHLLGELTVGCTADRGGADCPCRREPGDYPGPGCAACGKPVWRSPLGTADTVCHDHRVAAQEAMRRRFTERLAASPNAAGYRKH